VQAVINQVASSNGGVVYFPRGNYVVTGLKVPANVILMGAGAGATFLSVVGAVGSIGIEFTYRATSYNLGGLSSLTVYNTGALGASGVLTPANTDAFTKSQRWVFTDFAIRGVSGWAANLTIGDSASSAIQRFFIQGFYVAQNADAGQAAEVGILLKGARGVVNPDISAFKMRGVRTALQVSDFAEGFSLHDGEVVGSWEGVVCDSNPSKPGGYVHNVHFNVNRICIRLLRRRYITIGDNQYYRDGSFNEHGLGWSGVDATSCEGVKIGTVQTRIGVATPVFTSVHTGITVTDSPDVNIQGVSDGELAQLDKGIKITASATGLAGGVSLERLHGETLTNWIEFVGPVNDFSLGNVTERGAASLIPIVVTGTGLDKSSIKLPMTSTAILEVFKTPNRNAAVSKDVRARAHAPKIFESLVAGSGAYAVNYYFDTVSAVMGDTFLFKLVQIGGSNSTLNLYSGLSTASPALMSGGSLAAAGAGTNQYRLFTIVFTGTAWEIMAPVVTSA
jgi:hypothetical protein